VNGIRIVEVQITLGKKREGVLHKDINKALSLDYVGKRARNEEGKFTKSFSLLWRIFLYKNTTILIYLGNICSSLGCIGTPDILKHMHSLNWEIEPLGIGLFDCLFELIKVILPIQII
jgi:hypothetical protein